MGKKNINGIKEKLMDIEDRKIITHIYAHTWSLQGESKTTEQNKSQELKKKRQRDENRSKQEWEIHVASEFSIVIYKINLRKEERRD